MKDIRGLTLHRPWPTAIFRIGKDVENRSWKPSGRFVGSYLAIHAGKTFDEGAAEFIHHLTGKMIGPEDCFPAGHIVGVAQVARFVEASESPWFFGPWGWELSDKVIIDPISMRGAQGLWRLPPNVLTMVRQRYGQVVKVEIS